MAKDKPDNENWQVREYVEPKLEGESELITISTFAKRLRLHPQTLRNWEKAGLITPNRIGRERVYDQKDLERALLIKKFAKKGSSLKGIRALLKEIV